MKRERREIITMTANGIVTVSGHVRMSVSEVADLFGIYYRTAKRHIRAIEKAGIAEGDYTMSCIADGLKVYPEYYGLEMIIALSFRIQSKNAQELRKWILLKAGAADSRIEALLYSKNIVLN